MSTFEVMIRKIDSVRNHPNADRLSIVKILGFDAVVNKLPCGSQRYQDGELIAYIPEQAIIPEDVLKEYGFWREETTREDGTISPAKGMLAGKRGDRVAIATLRCHNSQGLIFPLRHGRLYRAGASIEVTEDQDVADFLGITKHAPPIPAALSGEVLGVPEMSFSYDIENWQNYPGFLDGDEVVAVEKCHGTNFRICYHPDIYEAELFGPDNNIGIASKSLKGKVFKNNRVNLGPLWDITPEDIARDKHMARAYWWQTRPGVPWVLKTFFGKRVKAPRPYNKSNLYVRVAIEQGLIEKINALGSKLKQRIDLYGEVFGTGVWNLTYGQPKPTFRAFDIAINGRFLDEAEKVAMFAEMGVERLPVLYRGPWNEAELIKCRDGKTTIGGTNIREGIVVTALGDQSKRMTPDGRRNLRPFLKMVSPAYLNQEDGSEGQ